MKFTTSRRRMSRASVAAASAATAAGLWLAAPAHGQIQFTVPADAPRGTLGNFGVKEVWTGSSPTITRIFDPGGGNSGTNILMNATPPANWRFAHYQTPVINIYNVAGGGGSANIVTSETEFGVSKASVVKNTINGAPGSGTVVGGNVEDVALFARGTLRIATPGTYSFGVNSDDGFFLAFPNQNVLNVVNGNTPGRDSYNGIPNAAGTFREHRGPGDTFTVVSFVEAGDYPIHLAFCERGGGAEVELYAAQGNFTSFGATNTWRLVGQPGVTEVRGRRYIGTTSPASNGWRAIELHPETAAGNIDPPPQGVVVNPANTPQNEDPTLNLTNSIESYRLARTNPSLTIADYSIRRSDRQHISMRDEENPGTTRASNGAAGADNLPFPIDGFDHGHLPDTTDHNYFGFGARTNLTIAGATATYTFGVRSDDSFRFRILNSAGVPQPILSFNGTAGLNVVGVDTPTDASNGTGAPDGTNDGFQSTNCCQDGFGRYNLAAGSYIAEIIMHEATGGASVQVFGAIGNWTEFNAAFQLLGQNLDNPDVVIVPGVTPGLPLVAQGPHVWNGGLDSNWTNARNWNQAELPLATDDVELRSIDPSVPAARSTITLAAGMVAKSLSFITSRFDAPYTLTGGSLTVNGPIRISSGQVATFTNTTVTANTISAGTTGAAGTLSLGAAGNVKIKTKAAGGTDATIGALQVAGGAAAPTGQLDVADNNLTINTAAIGDVAALIRAGFNNGAWTGQGITSSSLATAWAANDRSRNLGYQVNGAGATVKYTFSGDANLDNAVNVSDLGALATNYGQTGQVAAWGKGDFNHDGNIDVSDLGIMATYYGAGAAPGPNLTFAQALAAYPELAAAAVPEPAGLGLLALGALGLLRRRRRQA